jgi:hypothetical protein
MNNIQMLRVFKMNLYRSSEIVGRKFIWRPLLLSKINSFRLLLANWEKVKVE